MTSEKDGRGELQTREQPNTGFALGSAFVIIFIALVVGAFLELKKFVNRVRKRV